MNFEPSAAVEEMLACDGPILILGGPGSGKDDGFACQSRWPNRGPRSRSRNSFFSVSHGLRCVRF